MHDNFRLVEFWVVSASSKETVENGILPTILCKKFTLVLQTMWYCVKWLCLYLAPEQLHVTMNLDRENTVVSHFAASHKDFLLKSVLSSFHESVAYRWDSRIQNPERDSSSHQTVLWGLGTRLAREASTFIASCSIISMAVYIFNEI